MRKRKARGLLGRERNLRPRSLRILGPRHGLLGRRIPHLKQRIELLGEHADPLIHERPLSVLEAHGTLECRRLDVRARSVSKLLPIPFRNHEHVGG